MKIMHRGDMINKTAGLEKINEIDNSPQFFVILSKIFSLLESIGTIIAVDPP